MKIIEILFVFFKSLGVFKSRLLRNVLFSSYFLLFRFRFNKGFRIRHKNEYDRSFDFVSYFYKFDLVQKTNLLKKSLDSKSIKIVDLFIKRQIYTYTHNIIMEDDILNQEEWGEACKTYKFVKKCKANYPLIKNQYEESVFYYKSGLIFLPKDQIEKLENKDFIDAGAYIGDSAVVLSRDYKPDKVYAFEPNKYNFNLLKKTIKLNGLTNIIPIKMGIGDINSDLKMNFSESSSHISGDGKNVVKVTTIDSYVENKKLNLGLIKMDIEGYELEAIKGAKNSLKKFKPVLLISIYHTGKDFLEIKPLIEDWVDGYRFIIRKLNSAHPTFETVLIGYYDR